MIPATAPYVARFGEYSRAHDRIVASSRPVVAWDDEGRALVVDDKRGLLTPADSYRNFISVEQPRPGYVAAIPGGGWQLGWKQPDGTECVEQVLAWVIDSAGFGQAISVGDGLAEVVEPRDGNPRLIPPDATA